MPAHRQIQALLALVEGEAALEAVVELVARVGPGAPPALGRVVRLDRTAAPVWALVPVLVPALVQVVGRHSVPLGEEAWAYWSYFYR